MVNQISQANEDTSLLFRLEVFPKRGKRTYFNKAELIDWISEGRRMTIKEIEEEADNYIKRSN